MVDLGSKGVLDDAGAAASDVACCFAPETEAEALLVVDMLPALRRPEEPWFAERTNAALWAEGCM